MDKKISPPEKTEFKGRVKTIFYMQTIFAIIAFSAFPIFGAENLIYGTIITMVYCIFTAVMGYLLLNHVDRNLKIGLQIGIGILLLCIVVSLALLLSMLTPV